MKRVQDEKPERSAEVKAWLNKEIAAQKARYDAIVKEMEDLQEERNGWIAEFLKIIQTRGFNMNGDMRRQIPDEELPKRPDRPDADKVVW
ncbi:hypothetical protein [Luteithermobacter gelatinilyticus]|uniref:hypothetical protein n=1 Tax=Luteithermobacter gelatinilyticus TaxID=2582913 RepID=UPI0011074B7A|nr:hypothetical protein [Luteithermobacter gelatinilyticus]